MDIAQLTKDFGRISAPMTTPSGFQVIIREQNGDDDSILSNVSLTKDANSVNSFVQGVVVWASTGKNPNETLTMDQVLDMRLGDKYFILLSSRIFSLSPILKFGYTWAPEIPEVDYEEDLTHFVWDYSTPLPKTGDEGYFANRIIAYPVPIDQVFSELTLQSGKRVRYKFLNGHGEKYLLKLPEFQMHVNSRLIARELELWVDTKWVKVESFKMFNPTDMRELRNSLEELDPQFDGIIEIENPHNPNEKNNVSLLGINDFFYPREI
jgi:hypothetical protein